MTVYVDDMHLSPMGQFGRMDANTFDVIRQNVDQIEEGK
ncbi:hypothetical protein SAMN05444415_10272 [Salipiger profundus]|nr:hypothetical protein SAMN05444415_10272 [Salipiger profundus]